ncbi:hypothetical protein DPMN_116018 [Dreissena polymorpha]|uniref:Uncharacterized protein n=1 Tax=Dreissena polymorpha TaxID=45954 RepID=A0A9D4QTX3_DREPO|nr:hypothetical protein DPMN_116018 [Dreissena polymorpha]
MAYTSESDSQGSTFSAQEITHNFSQLISTKLGKECGSLILCSANRIYGAITPSLTKLGLPPKMYMCSKGNTMAL